VHEKKARKQSKPDPQEQVKTQWPFTRVDGKLLDRLHKQLRKQQPPPEYEPAPF